MGQTVTHLKMSATREKKSSKKHSRLASRLAVFEPILFGEDLKDKMFLDRPKTIFSSQLFFQTVEVKKEPRHDRYRLRS